MIDAIVLAGAKNAGKLKGVSDEPFEALIEIQGRPMIEFVLAALRACERLGRIIVVGPEAVAAAIDRGALGVEWIESGRNVVENMLRGIEHLGGDSPVLVVTSDIPLLTAEAVDDFVARSEASEADVYYPVVTREVNEAAFPGVRRTYVSLREGTFTGGNLALLRPDVVARSRHLIEQAYAMRKRPWQLSRMLGLKFIVKLLFHRLTVQEIEARVAGILGCRVMAVVSPYPEVGIDVDKPADLQLVTEALQRGEKRGGAACGEANGSP